MNPDPDPNPDPNPNNPNNLLETIILLGYNVRIGWRGGESIKLHASTYKRYISIARSEM